MLPLNITASDRIPTQHVLKQMQGKWSLMPGIYPHSMMFLRLRPHGYVIGVSKEVGEQLIKETDSKKIRKIIAPLHRQEMAAARSRRPSPGKMILMFQDKSGLRQVTAVTSGEEKAEKKSRGEKAASAEDPPVSGILRRLYQAQEGFFGAEDAARRAASRGVEKAVKRLPDRLRYIIRPGKLGKKAEKIKNLMESEVRLAVERGEHTRAEKIRQNFGEKLRRIAGPVLEAEADREKILKYGLPAAGVAGLAGLGLAASRTMPGVMRRLSQSIRMGSGPIADRPEEEQLTPEEINRLGRAEDFGAVMGLGLGLVGASKAPYDPRAAVVLPAMGLLGGTFGARGVAALGNEARRAMGRGPESRKMASAPSVSTGLPPGSVSARTPGTMLRPSTNTPSTGTAALKRMQSSGPSVSSVRQSPGVLRPPKVASNPHGGSIGAVVGGVAGGRRGLDKGLFTGAGGGTVGALVGQYVFPAVQSALEGSDNEDLAAASVPISLVASAIAGDVSGKVVNRLLGRSDKEDD